MREIVTLQLGQLSNYVANHFWNAQESYFTYSANEDTPIDHNVHWRAGLGADGSETFLPRTVIYDLKGGFGSLRKINAMYEAESEPSAADLWSGPSVVHKQPRLEPSAYQQNLNAGTQPPPLTKSDVRYWSDFSRVFYHPRSLVQLYDFELNSTTMPFERFAMGKELFETLDKDQDLADRDWRPFAEECDCMQGMQVFTTLDDAWGGFASSYLENLRDEYPKSSIWVWGMQNPMLDVSRAQRQLRMTNVAHSIADIAGQASTLIPLALPEDGLPSGVNIDYRSTWHTSAVFASAIETATLPSRLVTDSSGKPTSLDYLVECLNVEGNQPLATLRMSAKQKLPEAEEDSSQLDLFQVGKDKNKKKKENTKRVFGRITSSRGYDPTLEVDTEDGQRSDLRNRPRVGEPVIRKYETTLGMPLLDSHPRIYSGLDDQSSMAMSTNLTSDSRIVSRMRTLRTQVTWSLGLEDRELLGNSLAELADAYQDDWSSGSDEDDDDL